MQKDPEARNEENRIKLYLEACLSRKVDILSIKPIIKADRAKVPKDDISFLVWLYNEELLKEIVPSVLRNSDYTYGKSQPSSLFKFKLGTIIWDDLFNSNERLKNVLTNNQISSTPNSYFAVLAEAFIGSAQTYILDDDPRDKEVKPNQGETADIYYINGKPNEENKNIKTYHWFLMKDNSKLLLYSLVHFTVESNDIKCSNPNCTNQNISINEMKYCHNDQKYFCGICMEELHTKQTFGTLKKHVITQAISYSITYTNNCIDHKLKPLDFYCYDCNALYCTKCFDNGGAHFNKKQHEINTLSSIYNSIELEFNSLQVRIKDMIAFIDEEMEKRNSNSKEIQKLYKSVINEINERLDKAQEELENEVLFRSTYLASVSVEIQRLISEIDSKCSFLKSQYVNADQSTFISMSNMFNKYMKEELIPNLDMLCNLGFDQITSNLYHIEKKEQDQNKN